MVRAGRSDTSRRLNSGRGSGTIDEETGFRLLSDVLTGVDGRSDDLGISNLGDATTRNTVNVCQ